ncbi:MAG: hypothetical protein IKR57_05910 [Bacilli bacterium]|nr:hypothetical protein [Bacilli bacterium]
MDGNNVNNNIPNQPVGQNIPPNNQPQNTSPEYRLVIDEKPYKRRSLIPMLVMGLLFVGIAFGIKTLIFAIINPEEPFDPSSVETRKFEEILQDRNVSFYISGKIYTTRLSSDAEIVEIGNSVGYSLIRDSLYYKYFFQSNISTLKFDKTNYFIDKPSNSVNYLDEDNGIVVSIENLEQVDMDEGMMKKMCIDFINNTKESISSTPMTEYLKHAIIYGYKANLDFIKQVGYKKDVNNNTKEFTFTGGGIILSFVSSNKNTDEMEVKEFDDGLKIYTKDDKDYIYLDKNLFEYNISKQIIKEDEEETKYTIDEKHDYFVKSLKKTN